MTDPLTLLRRQIAEARNRRRLDATLSDPHIARDIGLPHRPREPRKLGQW